MSKILVIGDSCLDEFVYCSCERLSPEAPVPVLDVLYKVSNPGMAANVVQNLLALDHEPVLITNSDATTFTKTRYVEHKTNHIFLRIDSQKKVERIKDLYSISLRNYCAVIISDYNKGFLTESDIKYIAQNHPLTFLDSKTRLGDWAKAITFIKINEKEYLASKDYIDNNLYNNTIITLGENGAKFKDNIYPTEKVDVIDLSGAGDSFLAGLVLSYRKTKSIEKAIKFANKCAASVVSQRGVAVIKK